MGVPLTRWGLIQKLANRLNFGTNLLLDVNPFGWIEETLDLPVGNWIFSLALYPSISSDISLATSQRNRFVGILILPRRLVAHSHIGL